MRVAYKRKLRKLTSGFFNSLTDFALFTVSIMSYGSRGRDPIQSISKSIHIVKLTNPKSLKRAIYSAKYKGYLEKKKDYFKITELGLKRLQKNLPTYEKVRPWDGVLYLITYDIPETKRKYRDYLRAYLTKLGCGLLQQSVWITPYNPKKLIVNFIKESSLYGLILVSELREGSSIGGKDIREVLEQIYKLKELNEKYRNFVNKVEKGKLKGLALILEYLSVLKNDSQLPFELMADNYWGEDAYNIYKKEIISFKKSF